MRRRVARCPCSRCPCSSSSARSVAEVVDLAVEDGDDAAVLVRDRLVAGREVDHAQAAVPERAASPLRDDAVVGPAMADRVARGADDGRPRQGPARPGSGVHRSRTRRHTVPPGPESTSRARASPPPRTMGRSWIQNPPSRRRAPAPRARSGPAWTSAPRASTSSRAARSSGSCAARPSVAVLVAVESSSASPSASTWRSSSAPSCTATPSTGRCSGERGRASGCRFSPGCTSRSSPGRFYARASAVPEPGGSFLAGSCRALIILSVGLGTGYDFTTTGLGISTAVVTCSIAIGILRAAYSSLRSSS